MDREGKASELRNELFSVKWFCDLWEHNDSNTARISSGFKRSLTEERIYELTNATTEQDAVWYG